MNGNFTMGDTLNTSEAIFEKHKNERICVLSTTCTGKTTMIKQKPYWVDVDDVLGKVMTSDEIAFCSQVPWTEEIGNIYDKIMFERVKVEKGHPLFCSVILDCDVVVFIDISDKNLLDHCQKKGVDFNYALQMKEEIIKDWNKYKEKNDKIFYYVVMAE